MINVLKHRSVLLFVNAFFITVIASTTTFANTRHQTQKDTMATGNYAEVNGIKMYYEIQGEGKPLVLIHGGGSNIQTTFGSVLPQFAKHYKVIAVDLQAHGRTSDRNTPESFEQDADDVAALLKQLGIAKAYFFGFSNGGSSALQIAIRHAEIVDKIVAASSAYRRDAFMPGFFEGLQKATLSDMPKPFQDAFLKLNPDTNALLTMFNKDRLRMVNFKDWDESLLQQIKVPVLIMNSDKDVVLPAHALKMASIIPHAELIILPGTHGAFINEGGAAPAGSNLPEITVKLVQSFLDK